MMICVNDDDDEDQYRHCLQSGDVLVREMGVHDKISYWW